VLLICSNPSGTPGAAIGLPRMTDTSPTSNARNYPLLAVPHIQLHGPVDDAMYDNFTSQLVAAPAEGPLVEPQRLGIDEIDPMFRGVGNALVRAKFEHRPS